MAPHGPRCSACGGHLPDAASFCPACGASTGRIVVEERGEPEVSVTSAAEVAFDRSPWWRRVAVLAVVGLLAGAAVVVGRGRGHEPAEDERPVALVIPGATARGLVPTGVEVVGTAGLSQDVAADEDGAVWLGARGWVARVDPVTGEATTWTVADDAALASVRGLADAAGPGVWLLADHSVLWFDGERLVELPVPEIIGTPTAVVDAGGEPWITTAFTTARWSGEWVTPGPGVPGPLAADGDGNLWGATAGNALARFQRGEPSRPDMAWTDVRDDSGATFRAVHDIVADGHGGVWVLLGTAAQSPCRRVVHIEATSHLDLELPYPLRPYGDGALAVAVDGTLWAVGNGALGAYSPSGTWTLFTSEDGVPAGEDLDVVVSGTDPVVVAAGEVRRLDGSQLVRAWADATRLPCDPMPATVAVSRDELWLPCSADDRADLWRFLRPTWTRLPYTMGFWGGEWLDGRSGIAVHATMGTVVRYDGETATIVTEEARSRPAIGPDGTVWIAEQAVSPTGAHIVGHRPDGSTVDLGPSPATDLVHLAAGTTVLAATSWDDDGLSLRLHRWDGAWQDVAMPPWSDRPAPPSTLLVDAHDTVWLGADFRHWGTVARLAGGTWTAEDVIVAVEYLEEVAPGVVCASGAEGAACFDAGGVVEGMVPPVPAGVDGTLVPADDGSWWLVGRQIALVP